MENRTFNSQRNMISGFLNKILNIFFPFMIRTIMIRTLGSQFLGLNSLFTSILSVLSLTELGFTTAVVYSMYRPIAEGDVGTVRAILSYFRKIYRAIGLILLIIGLCLLPFLPKLIHGSYPDSVNIYVLFLIYLGNSCVSYWLFAYYNALVTALQRIDVANNVNAITTGVMYCFQIIVLLFTRNYYVYVIAMPLFSIINNLALRERVKAKFPQYYCEGSIGKKLKKDIRIKVSGLFLDRMTNVTRNSFDSIFISMFLGLTQTAIYNNYYYILSAVTGMMLIITNSISASAGNSVAVESISKNFRDMRRINSIYMWLAGWFIICLLCLYQPFMEIWMGKSALFPIKTVILICVYFYALKMGDIREVYSSAAGLWWQNRYRAIAETIVNLGLNYSLGKIWGIDGIILATLISLVFINFGYGSTIIFRYYYKINQCYIYFLDHLVYAVVTVVGALITFYFASLTRFSNGYLTLMARGVWAVVVPNAIFYFIYSKIPFTNSSILWIKHKMLHKFGLRRRRN